MRMKQLLFGLVIVGLAQFGPSLPKASAGLILNFGQTSNTNTITGTKTSDTGFTISGTDVAIQITQIDPTSGLTPPISAFLNLNLTSTAAAGSFAGIAVFQAFSGSVQITSGAGGSGVNYLSTTTLAGLLLGINGGATSSFGNTPGDVTFSSSVFGPLGNPMDISRQLGNQTPTLALQGNSLQSFTASVTGTASATIPEPSSLVTAMIGFAAVAPLVRRRFCKTDSRT